jgi:hypothetical protein
LKLKPIVQIALFEYKINAVVAPRILKITGNNLTECGINSESIIILLFGETNNALPQKSVPKPIIISRVINPIKIAPNLKMNNGNLIKIGDS